MTSELQGNRYLHVLFGALTMYTRNLVEEDPRFAHVPLLYGMLVSMQKNRGMCDFIHHMV